MSNEPKTDNKHESRPHDQDKSRDKHAGQHSQQDKSSEGLDAMSDNGPQEKAGKGKIATSEPGGSPSDRKQA